MASIRAFLYKRLYLNEETGWGFAIFKDETNDKLQIKVQGTIGRMQSKMIYELNGDYINDPKYGKSFQMDSYKVAEIISSEQAIKFLSSPLFPSIGKTTAKLIVDFYGDNVIKKIKDNPESLETIKGLKKEYSIIIANVIAGLKQDEKITIDFYENNFKIDILNELRRLCETEEEIESILKNDFYGFCLKRKMEFRFKDIDNIAKFYGVGEFDDIRVGYWAHNIVNEILFQTGNSYTNKNSLIKSLFKELNCYNEDVIMDGLMYAKIKELLFFKEGRIYSQISWFDENIIADRTLDLASKSLEIKETKMLKMINEVEIEIGREINNEDFEYTPQQIEALKLFTTKGLTILTGGPGTGKTTVIRGMVKIFEKLQGRLTFDSVALVAPTGRAAARIRESTNYKLDATTIHRLLKIKKGNNQEAHTKTNPLKQKLIIVDECSMVDNFIFARLLEATEKTEKIVFVGDIDQLPSVSYGNVFSDLIEANVFSTVKLNEVKRQSDDSGIIELANAIINEKVETLDLNSLKNVHNFLDGKNNKMAIIKEIYDKNITECKKDPLNVQIISPMYGNELGVERINFEIQKEFNSNIFDEKNIVEYGKNRYAIKDRIMYLENDPDLDLSNGDVGIIEDILLKKNKLEAMTVNFSNRYVVLNKTHLDKITLSYACTVHKTQGSEYKNVIIIMEKSPSANFFLNKKIVYTGITRAKENVYIVGDSRTFIGACHKQAPKRLTTLKEKILERWN